MIEMSNIKSFYDIFVNLAKVLEQEFFFENNNGQLFLYTSRSFTFDIVNR